MRKQFTSFCCLLQSAVDQSVKGRAFSVVLGDVLDPPPPQPFTQRHRGAGVVFFLTAQRGQSVGQDPLEGQAAFSMGETLYVPVGLARATSDMLVSASGGEGVKQPGHLPWASVMRSWASSENPSRPMPQSRQVLLACPSTQRAVLRWTSSAQFLGHSSGLM